MTRIALKRISAAMQAAAFVLSLCPAAALADATPPAAPAAAASEATAPAQAALPADAGAPADAAAPSATPSPEGPMAESNDTAAANPYGLSELWAQGDFVAKGTLVILGLMSMGSWYILFSKLAEQRHLLAEARGLSKKIGGAGSFRAGIDKLGKSSPFRSIAEDGFTAATQHAGGLGADVTLLDWTNMAVGRAADGIAARLQGGLSFLATVGSTAPFVGLFGTVWGIYHALIAIGLAGQASIDKVAGPVGEALIMTAIGLAVAVPAVLGYNWLVRRNKAAIDLLRRFANDVLIEVLHEGVAGAVAPKRAANGH
jgi:biopolymer transport protein ExbB